MPQNLAQESPSLVQRIPEVAFSGPKLLCVQSGMEMNSQVVSCLANKIKVLKEEDEWMKNEVVDPGPLLGASGLSQANSMAGGMVMPLGNMTLSPPIVGSSRSISLSPSGSSVDASPAPMVLHSPSVMAPMVESPATSPSGSPPILQAMTLSLPETPLQPSTLVETILPDNSNILSPPSIIEPVTIITDVPPPMVNVMTSGGSIVEPTSMMEPPQNPSLIAPTPAASIIEAVPTSSSNAMMKLDPSMATIEKFVSSTVSSTPLPSLNVERYFSHIENKDSLAEDVKVKYETLTSSGAHFSGSSKQVLESFPPKEVMEPFAPKQVIEPFPGASSGGFFPTADPKQPAPSAQQLPPQPPAMPNVPHELTVMSDTDLISYINPSCFDQV